MLKKLSLATLLKSSRRDVKRIICIVLVTLLALASNLASASDIQITSVTSDLVANPKPSETFHLTMNAAGPEGANLVHRFYYKAGYGTPQFDTNGWQVIQEWSPANGVDCSFPSPGDNYLIMGHVVPEGEAWQFGDAQGGFNFNVVMSDDVQITAVTSNLTAVPNTGETLRLTIDAVGPEGATLNYRFYYRAGYGLDPETWGNNTWQLVQDWDTVNWVDYSFPDPGNYCLVGQVTVAGESWEVGDPQGGFNVTVIDPDRPEGWTEVTHGNNASPNYDVVYAQDVVKRIDLIIDPADWQAMLDDRTAAYGPFNSGLAAFIDLLGGGNPDEWVMDLPDPIYQPCTLICEGKNWWHVGVRFKGQSSLIFPWMMGVMKFPFRFDMDEFEDEYPEIQNQRFYGFKELSLGNNSMDNSLLREKVAADIFREAGVPAPQTAFYRLFVDYGEGPIYFGLYTLVEVPREPMLESQFGESGGNLYKAVLGEGATWDAYDPASFEKKTNRGENDWSDMEALFTALHAPRTDPAAWRAGLEAVFDVDGFLRWLAINTVIQNWDTYGNMPQNYFLYTDPSDGLLHWIPWDNNMALLSSGGPGLAPPLSLCLDATAVGNDWPLIRYLIDDPVYYPIYVSDVNDTIEGAFTVARQQDRLRDAHALISPYVVGPEGEQEGYTFTSPNSFEAELEVLLGHVENRREAALQFLADGTCTEPGTDDKVVATVTVPFNFACTPELIVSVFFTSFPPQPGTMPAAIGNSYPAPQIGPGIPYELTTTQAGLQGEYFLAVTVYCPGGGGGMLPVSGVDWVGGAMFPLTLGPGTGTVDAGRIRLILAP